ncbi:MAG TPA: LysM peptidoglycan-binding domain-containing protein [Mesotoga infera]|uniref:LysM peptidoglycan-binding domain-containing protein n=1 Tax=Mesotoga infera TaxID=1236046 RepID=A0A7C1CVI6_9BACT|nr:LysM peptidoglycan-binding domain-containing protein [Mesotoga infera]
MRRLLSLIFIISFSTLLLASNLLLTIIHTSDIHGNVFPIDYTTGEFADVGLAKVSSFVNHMRSTNPSTIVIDTGDLIQGTPFSYYFARMDDSTVNPVISAMNMIGFTASVIGSHEFSYGPKLLEEAVNCAEFPFLCANVVFEGSEDPVFPPYEILTLESDDEKLRIAILGLTTTLTQKWEDPEHIAGLSFLDPVCVAEKYVALLREEADVLIVAYHGGFERDLATGEPTEELSGENVGYEILKRVEGIDVMLTGYQHRTISEIVDGVVVSQPSSRGSFVGRVELGLEKRDGGWQIIDRSAGLVSMRAYNADIALMEKLGDFENHVQNWLDQRAGFAVGDFYIGDHFEAALKDNALVEFINKVQMEASGASISCASILTDEITGWMTGPITFRDIISVYPSSSTLKVLRVTGADIKAALEKSAECFAYTDNEIALSEGCINSKSLHKDYYMWEGIDYIIAVDRPLGERVLSLRRNGKPLDMNETYEIVLNSYRAGGGGGYYMFEGRPVQRNIMLDISEIMMDYVMDRHVINAEVDNNWSVGTGFIHTIGWNETLRSIAEMYGISASEIMEYNPDLTRVRSIPTGTELIIYTPSIR